jgi:glucose-6-phosphate isomerase
METLTFDYSYTKDFIRSHELDYLQPFLQAAQQQLLTKTGPGNDFLGWVDLPENYDRDEFAQIQEAAQQIQSQSEVLVVIGIGGSYLGAKAALSFLSHTYYNQLPANKRPGPEIYFAGTNLSGTHLQHLLDVIGDRDFSINMVSKSGTTTEPAIAFRILRERLEKNVGKEAAKKRIFATTDREKGALKTLADREGYTSFVVPDDIGGRFSVLTAVGLLPIAVAGIDIEDLMAGAAKAREHGQQDLMDNPSLQYAGIRNLLYRKGFGIEMLINYEPRLVYLAEWWKQLFGESEGKDQKGIFPASANFTTDLHSLGQYVQDGPRHLFETLVQVKEVPHGLLIGENPSNLDGLNYLAGQSVDYVNEKAAEGTLQAHLSGGVPNLIIQLPQASAFHLGYLFYFFESACAVSGYLLGVNPFDQPGVEAYKKNMFALLGRP